MVNARVLGVGLAGAALGIAAGTTSTRDGRVRAVDALAGGTIAVVGGVALGTLAMRWAHPGWAAAGAAAGFGAMLVATAVRNQDPELPRDAVLGTIHMTDGTDATVRFRSWRGHGYDTRREAILGKDHPTDAGALLGVERPDGQAVWHYAEVSITGEDGTPVDVDPAALYSQVYRSRGDGTYDAQWSDVPGDGRVVAGMYEHGEGFQIPMSNEPHRIDIDAMQLAPGS